MDSISCEVNSYLNQLSCSSDFGCGFFLFWSFKQVFKALGLFLLLGFGLIVIKIRFLRGSSGKSGSLINGICANHGFDVRGGSKVSSCKFKLLKNVLDSSPPAIDKLGKTKLLNCKADGYNEATNVCSEEYCCNKDYDDGDGDGDDDENQYCDEDKEFDALTLRKLIKTERERANAASKELEKERMSAATAVEESMAMILRLQNEKSSIEMESRQYRRLAEEKQLYDHEVIRSLQWLVERHESDRAVLEEQLRLCEQNFRLSMRRDETIDEFEDVEESFCSARGSSEDALDYSLFSSLDLDSSQEHASQ